MNDIKIIEVEFDATMRPCESKYLRGAVIRKLEGTAQTDLQHNHLDDKGAVRYAYPLVQYKCLDGRAAVVCIGRGVEVAEALLRVYDDRLQLGNRPVDAPIRAVRSRTFLPQCDNRGFRYRIARWQPLNADNYPRYRELVALTDKIVFLEQILTGHVLGLYQGIGVFADRAVCCNLTRLSDPYTDKYKGFTTTLFDVEFITNYSLPANCGLGKGSSLGFGTIKELE